MVLPENFAFLSRRPSDKLSVAELLDPADPGRIVQAVADIARTHGMWVIAGGLPEISPDTSPRDGGERVGGIVRVYNTCLAVAPDGEIAAAYRKIHLFDVAIPDSAVFRESESTERGSEIVSVETPLARIGLSVCYDLRFPELYRKLALEHRAQVLAVPAAFTAYTGAAHWHTLLRSRAIENQCYVIAAAQDGRHNDKRESFGHSLLIDPWGQIIAELAEGEGLAVAEIDLDHLDATRQRMPCLEHPVLWR